MRHTRVDLRQASAASSATETFGTVLACRALPQPQSDLAHSKCRTRAKPELGQHYNETTLASHILCLTRVTRIFQKSVFTETTPGRPGGRPRRVFCCADATRPRAAYFSL